MNSDTQIIAKLTVTCIAFILWIYTQKKLGSRIHKDSSTIYDSLLQYTSRINKRLHESPKAVQYLLISSSLIVDVLGLCLILSGIFGPSFQPLFGLILLFVLRQMCQAVCLLPLPEGIIWKDPKFPSLFVTYGVSSDLFFSGHTALVVFGALFLSSGQNLAVAVLCGLIVFYEILVVIVLRAHWTMDIITGAIAALWIYDISKKYSPILDSWFANL